METYCDILQVIGSGVEIPTSIMYKTNLCWTVMQSYMKTLLTRGLVVEEAKAGKRVYHLTQKGFEVLSQFLSLRDGLFLNVE